MTKEEINEKYAILESRENLLNSLAKDLKIELDDLTNSKNISELKKTELKKEVEIRRRLSEINDELDKIQEEYEELDQEVLKLKSKNEERQKANRRKKAIKTTALVASIVILASLIANIPYGVAKCVRDKKANDKASSTDKSLTLITDKPLETDTIIVKTPDASAGPVVTPTNAVESVVTPEPTLAPVLGDATNDEDVEKAAERILTENVNAIIEAENDPQYTSLASKENIEDIIRVVNGELPKYDKYDEYTVRETSNKMSDIFANRGSVGNTLYEVNYSNLFPDDSEEANYVATYDEIYNNIAKCRAEGNVDGFAVQVAELGKKLYNEWHLAGLYGGYNPYLLPTEKGFFVLESCIGPYPNFVEEYKREHCIKVYVDGCWDAEKKEYRKFEVTDIFEAIYMGRSSNNEVTVLRNDEVFCIRDEKLKDAEEFLKNKYYSEINVKKLG